MFTSGGKGGVGRGRKRGIEKGKPGRSATCDRRQIRAGTRFALNENEETVDNEAALTRRGAMLIPP